jgi:hypothetical protein
VAAQQIVKGIALGVDGPGGRDQFGVEAFAASPRGS